MDSEITWQPVEDKAVSANILVTSDIHTSGIKSINTKGASIIILAGDIMGGGMDSDEAGYRYLENEFFPWCRENGDKQIIITAGNHDKFLFRMWVMKKNLHWPSNCSYLIDKGRTIDGIKMYGTPWCLKNRPGRFEADEAKLAEIFKNIPDNLDILITHQPPYIPGEKVDYSEWSGTHEGSKELTEVLLKKKPKVVICGHVHGGDREPIDYEGMKIMNVARVKEDRSKEAYKPTIIRFTYEI